MCGHSSVAVKNFYLLEDRKADAEAVESFNDILGSFESCDTSAKRCDSYQSPSYASMDPMKKTRLYYYFYIYIYNLAN